MFKFYIIQTFPWILYILCVLLDISKVLFVCTNLAPACDQEVSFLDLLLKFYIKDFKNCLTFDEFS